MPRTFVIFLKQGAVAKEVIDSLLQSRLKYGTAVLLGGGHCYKFMNVMLTHGANIEHLRVDGSLDGGTWCGMLKAMPKLKSAVITHHRSAYYFTARPEELPDLSKLVSLKLHTNDRTLLRVFANCRQLKTLYVEMEYAGKELHTFMASQERLQTLVVEHFNGNAFNGLRFKTPLRSLKIKEVDTTEGPIDWDRFTRDNPAITELSIGYFSKPEDVDFVAISGNLKQLHTLTVKCVMNCDATFFDIIRQNCKKLKSLKLNVASFEVDVSTLQDISCMSLHPY